MTRTRNTPPLRYKTFEQPAGTLQIVELLHGRCHVGYRAKGDRWRHWGQGEGGYNATVARFAECPTFNPEASAGAVR